MGVLTVPDAANLEAGVFVDEGFFFAKSSIYISLESFKEGRAGKGREAIRYGGELGAGNSVPVVLKVLGNDEGGACVDVVDGAVIVVVVVVGDLRYGKPSQRNRMNMRDGYTDQEMGNGFFEVLLDPLNNQLALVGWRVRNHNAVFELGNQGGISRGVVEDNMGQR